MCHTANRLTALRSANRCQAYAGNASVAGKPGVAQAATRAAVAARKAAAAYAVGNTAAIKAAKADYRAAYDSIADAVALASC